MIIFCNQSGKIDRVIPDRVYQGSAGVNKIYFVGQFPSSSQVTASYKLPNGIVTSPRMLTRIKALDELDGLDGLKAPNGEIYNVWEAVIGARPKVEDGAIVKDDDGNVVYDLDYSVTENYGTATIQFFVYGSSIGSSVNGIGANIQGGNIATEAVSFTIEKAVPVVLPAYFDEEGEVKVVLAQILEMLSNTKQLYENRESDIATLQTDLDAAEETIGDHGATIIQHAIQLGAQATLIEIAQGNIATLQGNVSELSENDTAQQGKIDEVEATADGIKQEIPKLVANLTAELVEDKLNIKLYNKDGTLLGERIVDLPLEELIVSGSYDEETKKIVLVTKDGAEIDVPVGDLVNGLLNETDIGTKVASLVRGKVPLEQMPDGIGVVADAVQKTGDRMTGDLYIDGDNGYEQLLLSHDHISMQDAEASKTTSITTSYVEIRDMGGVFNTKYYRDKITNLGPHDDGSFVTYTYTFPMYSGTLTTEEYVAENFIAKPTTDEDKAKACETIGALKAVTNKASFVRVYVTKADGTQSTYNVGTTPAGIGNYFLALYLPEVLGDVEAQSWLVSKTPTKPYHTATKHFVENLPDHLTMTDDQKAKWQGMIGVSAGGGGGGTKLYKHTISMYFGFSQTGGNSHLISNMIIQSTLPDLRVAYGDEGGTTLDLQRIVEAGEGYRFYGKLWRTYDGEGNNLTLLMTAPVAPAPTAAWIMTTNLVTGDDVDLYPGEITSYEVEEL